MYDEQAERSGYCDGSNTSVMEATLTTRCLQTALSSAPPSALPSQQTLADQKPSQELSPDSGNGEDLDEFDPLKASPKCSDTKNESDQEALRSLSNSTISPFDCFDKGRDMTAVETSEANQLGGERDGSPGSESGGQVALASHKDRSTESERKEKVSTVSEEEVNLISLEEKPQVSLISTNVGAQNLPKESIVHYSDAFNNRGLNSSILATCGSSLPCGPFSRSCTPIRKNQQHQETSGPFSLPEGKGALHDGIFKTLPYQLNCDKTKRGPFSIQSLETAQETTTCTNIYYPEYYSNYRSRLVRRYTNPEVVRTQPMSGGLLTTSCELITSPSGQCACVNPGTSHACAARPTHKLSPGVLNPMFDQGSCDTRVTFASMPSTPRKFSLDLNYIPRDFSLPEFPQTAVSSVIPIRLKEGTKLVSLDSAKSECQCLSSQPSPPNVSSSDEQSNHCHQNTDTTSSAMSQGVSESSYGVTTSSSASGTGLEALAYKDLGRDLPSLNAMAKVLGTVRSSVKPPVLTSPDWFSFLTPSQESYTQKLFTPGDLQEELMYPAPYGISSEVYQNINAQEADFVLLKPTRKPRTEPLPPLSKADTAPKVCKQDTDPKTSNANKTTDVSSTLQSTTQCETTTIQSKVTTTVSSDTKKPESPVGLIEPLATEDEEALKEGAQESRKLSLSERRKTSLDKIYIPRAVEPVSLLDVKIDNFDRDEYVSYKKTLGENDVLIPDCPLLPCNSMLTDISKITKTRRNSKGNGNRSTDSERSRKLPIITDHVMEINLENISKSLEQKTPSRKQSISKNEINQKDNENVKNNLKTSKDKGHDQTPHENVKNTDKLTDKKDNNNHINNNKKSQKNMASPITSPTVEDPFFLQDQALSKRPNALRKQSLPTEELFGARRPRANRRSSLNPSSDFLQPGRATSRGTFPAVRETEENHFLFEDDTPRRKLWHRRHVLNARNGEDYFVPPSEKKDGSPERPGRGRSKTGQRKRDKLFINRKPEWKSYCENSITIKTSARRSDSQSNGMRKMDANASKSEGFGKYSASSRHRDLSTNSDDSSDSPGKDSKGPSGKYTGLDDREGCSTRTQRKTRTHKSPRKGRRQAREGHVNPMAKLSPLGFESKGDLFANKGCALEGDVITEGVPLVPYEPLVENVTPTSPGASGTYSDAPPPHTGATRYGTAFLA